MAYGMNDGSEDPTAGDELLKQMKARLRFLEEHIKFLKPMEAEAKKLSAAIAAYDTKTTYRSERL